ncbi:MG2 domain-containing protein [Terrarubrum flagellatum]|uniref:alpha-2-macroglobulin family protein n=1 Tax=Terrirubrum flagellatum TaxID=2895980 RepID=UPI0031451615
MIARAWNAFALFVLLLVGLSAAHAQQPTKSYVREDLASQLVRLEDSLKREGAGLSGQPSETLRRGADAILARNPREAMRLAIGAIAADSNNAAAWLTFSKAAGQVDSGTNYSERYELRNRTLTAAYGYYMRSSGRPQEAAALANLADIFQQREQWRSALDAYKASLALADNAPVRAAYQTLRESKGFRMTDYKVDADGATPRICFEFSEPLARGRVDFAPYVSVSGVSNPAVNAEGSQLCVEGLKHGERYTVALRQGLPSSVDEALLKTVDQDIYIKDRSAQVRFSGKNYVLPRTGQEGIPVISVNTTEVFIDVYRIGDRSLLPTVRSEDFLANLSRSSADDIEKQKGVKVWTGTLAVQRDLNRDVTTAFPVLEAVKTLEPGVYVMTGRAEKKQVKQSDSDYDGDSSSVATQWFIVSDLGLTAFSGEDGVHVIVRSLASAQPVEGAEIRLVAKNNEILATKATDARGIVKFDPGLARGAGGMSPGLVTATSNGDYGFLDLASTAFDLSDRGVKGRTAPGPLDAFMFTERGVYRGGETVQVTAMLRDAQGRAPRNLPLTLIAKRPDGVEYKRAVVQDQGLGGRSYSLPLISGAQRGTWRLEIYADPKGDSLGDTTFLVEDYVPERIELKLNPKKTPIGGDEPAIVDVDARYLYGAPGSDLQVTGEIIVRKATKNPIPGMDGFSYGIDDENFENVNKELEDLPQTDAQGKATVSADLPEFETTRPVEARVTLRVGESGGRAVERSTVIPIAPKAPVIAVKKLFDDTSIGDGANAEFEVALVNPDGTRLARQGLQWTLYRVTRSYQWYNKDGRWGYEPIKTTRRISDGKVDASDKALGKVSVPVNWGWYRLEVGSGATMTSVTFYAGWSGEPKTDTPDLLDVSLDKESYKSGDKMKLTLRPGFAGKATIGIVGDKVYDWRVMDVAAGGTTIELDAKAEWGAGAYVVALAHRPLDQAAKRMPGRALGLAWFSVDKDSRKLTVEATPEKIIKPRGTLDIPIKLAGLTAGEEAYVTVSAVDLGILNLTRYETPDPFDYYFGQRQLSAEIRDLYGLLIDGMQGTRGAIRSGGDASANSGENSPPRDAPMVRYSGVVKVGPDGTAKISFDIPAFNGTARVAVHAWSKDKVASAQTDVIIRDPVVLLGTLPRFMSVGDRSRFHLAIDNVEGPAGDYVLDVDIRGPVGAPADALRRTLRLGAKQKAEASLPISASDVGTATVAFRLTGPGGVDLTQAMTLNVAPGSVGLVRRTVRALPPQSSLTISSDLTADLLPSSASVSVTVSPYGALDVPSLLAALDRYPYGCTEQTVSRAMPLLYVNRLASQEQLALDAKADDRVRESIDRVLARQDSNGAFGLWSVGGNDIWLDAFVTDFLTRARERNFTVPQLAFDLALDRLRNHVANADVEKGKGQDLAYAIYVLARNGRPVIGDLRYLVDTKLTDFGTPLARAQLGAALGLLGDKARAQKAFASALELLRTSRDNGFSREDYGSRLRDGAGIITLASETGMDRSQIVLASSAVTEARDVSRYTSTQEQAWMVLAAQAMAKDSESLTVTVDGAEHKGALYRTWRGLALDSKPITITNASNSPAQMVVSTSGNPLTPEPAVRQGYVVERSYYKQDGTEVDLTKPVKQNDRMVVVLKITEQRATYARLLLVDMLPAGFEIDNPNLVDSAQVGALSWLKRTMEPANAEYRDDRFVAAFDRYPSQQASFTVAYMVRAVSPGRYVHPPALVEDMYRPDRFGRTAFGSLEVTPARP